MAFICYVNLVNGVAYSDHFSQTGIPYKMPTENEVLATHNFLSIYKWNINCFYTLLFLFFGNLCMCFAYKHVLKEWETSNSVWTRTADNHLLTHAAGHFDSRSFLVLTEVSHHHPIKKKNVADPYSNKLHVQPMPLYKAKVTLLNRKSELSYSRDSKPICLNDGNQSIFC